MEINRLRSFLQRHHLIALDTSIFIYHLEANPHFVELTDHIFAWLERPGNLAIASTVTMTEVLVHPYREQIPRAKDDYFALLSSIPHLEWVPVSLEIADLAARYRAQYRLQTPDALHAATAAHMQATAFITNDAIFSRISSLDTLVLGRVV